MSSLLVQLKNEKAVDIHATKPTELFDVNWDAGSVGFVAVLAKDFENSEGPWRAHRRRSCFSGLSKVSNASLRTIARTIESLWLRGYLRSVTREQATRCCVYWCDGRQVD